VLLGVVALTSAQPAHLLQDPDSPYLTHSSRMEEEPQTGTFVALQPLALVDHVCTVSGALLGSLLANGGGTCARGTDAAELGGSKRVSLEEIQRLLGRPGARPHVCGQAACARLMPAAGAAQLLTIIMRQGSVRSWSLASSCSAWCRSSALNHNANCMQ